ncbi:MAG TPA: response regulator transcription factor [Phycisphaerae bacterium]|nr:response regulator transcription factor [Phycisphaerae bacterium]
MSKQTVLVVEDEEDIAELVAIHLSKEGYQVVRAATGEDGLRLVREKRPALVVLDLMLPGMDGLEVCRQIRNDPESQQVAVLMLTAKGEESDIVVGLQLGADDYVTKPFSPKVLVARVKALLRRKEQPAADSEASICIHELTIHPGRREVLVRGKPVSLTYTEFGVLHILARRPGWVFTRTQIRDASRGEDSISTDRAVDVQIVSLRRKLGSAGRYIETVRGIGYRFKE